MDKEKLRLEREKRQARIRASGSSRLSKITQVAGTQDFKPPVNTQALTPAATPSDSTSTSSSHEKSPLSSSTFNTNDTTPDFSTGTPLDAIFAAAREQMQQMQQQEPQGQQQQQQQQTPAKQSSNKHVFIWGIVHLIMAVLIGLYAALGNPWYSTVIFMTLQVAQLSLQLLLGQASSGLPKFVAPFVGMLPRNRQRQVKTVGGLISALNTAYEDFSIALLVFGVFSLGGRDYKRVLV